jgi:hypothetical protein
VSRQQPAQLGDARVESGVPIGELLPESAVVVVAGTDADGHVEAAASELVEGADLLGDHRHRMLR